MQHVKTLTLTGLLLALTACSASTKSVDPKQIDVSLPDESLLQNCDFAAQLRGPLNQAAAETAWRSDRVSLAECRGRHSALVTWARATVATLNGEEE